MSCLSSCQEMGHVLLQDACCEGRESKFSSLLSVGLRPCCCTEHCAHSSIQGPQGSTLSLSNRQVKGGNPSQKGVPNQIKVLLELGSFISACLIKFKPICCIQNSYMGESGFIKILMIYPGDSFTKPKVNFHTQGPVHQGLTSPTRHTCVIVSSPYFLFCRWRANIRVASFRFFERSPTEPMPGGRLSHQALVYEFPSQA